MADVHFPLGVPLCFLHLPRASHTQPVMHACRLSGKGFTDMTLRAADEAQNPMVHCSGGVGTLELGDAMVAEQNPALKHKPNAAWERASLCHEN